MIKAKLKVKLAEFFTPEHMKHNVLLATTHNNKNQSINQ